ncbi:amidohydrolase family protein [Hydrogenophaga sp. OTU3427]|uniref:amidohydrolase family protein n=1 Tax=Hydrogenophaga sp. OTU3427 TaxID=3043856 RepID=UPI00313C6F83
MTRLLVRHAEVVTMDTAGDLPVADILVQDGEIIALGPGLPATDAEVVDASGCIALPGIIDAHTCLWQSVLRNWVPDLWGGRYFADLLPLRRCFRAQDNYISGWIGGAEMLSCGTTTVVDYCHNIAGPGYAHAAITGLKETGIRHVFTYSFMNEQPDDFTDSRARFADAARIFDEFHDAAGLTTIHFGIESVGAAHLSQQLTFAREHGVMSCIHINARNDIAQLRTHDLLGPDLLAIHGNLITDLELDAMAQVRMPLCFTPSADVQGTPADVVRRARLRDVPLVYGCDVPCHVASDTLQQLRYLFHVQGYIDGTVARSRAPADTRRPAPGEAMPLLRPRDLLRSATIDAATVLGMDKRIGSIAVGKRADIVLVRKDEYGGASGDPCAYVLLQASARHIDTVMVDGEIRVKGGRVVDFDAQRARHLAHEARKRLIGAT